MCAKTDNYFLYHQCVSNLYKGVLKTYAQYKFIEMNVFLQNQKTLNNLIFVHDATKVAHTFVNLVLLTYLIFSIINF